MYKVPVIQGQSLLDIAIQEYGGVEHIFKIIEDNPTLTLNSNIGAGDSIEIDETYSGTADVSAKFQADKTKGIYPVNYSDAETGAYNTDFNDDYDI